MHVNSSSLDDYLFGEFKGTRHLSPRTFSPLFHGTILGACSSVEVRLVVAHRAIETTK